MRVLVAGVILARLLAPAVAPAATLNTLVQFHGVDGQDVVGNIIGLPGSILAAGQSSSTVNQFTKPATAAGAWTNSVIHRFPAFSGDGTYPAGGLIAAGGLVFGTTSGGGNTACVNGCGTVFQLTPPVTPGGSWTETQLLVMAPDANGFQPSGTPLMKGSTTLFTTAIHAANDVPRPGSTAGPVGGVVFALAKPASGTGPWTETIIHHFDAAALDGDTPFGPLTLAPDHAIYGTSFTGGKCNQGTVFRLTPPATKGGSWNETLVHEFGATATGCDYDDGEQPVAGVAAAGGKLYGTTRGGTGLGCGTAFVITPNATPAYQKIYKFGQTATDACSPQAPVRVDATGVVFGTSVFGGSAAHSIECPSGCGTVYQLTPQAAGQPYVAAVLQSFAGGTDGSEPRSNLLGGPASGFFGVASHGGFAADTAVPDYQSFGTLYKFKP